MVNLWDLNELFSSDEKRYLRKSKQRYSSFNNFINYKMIEHDNKREKHATIFSRLDGAWLIPFGWILYLFTYFEHLHYTSRSCPYYYRYSHVEVSQNIIILYLRRSGFWRQLFDLVKAAWSTYVWGSSAFQGIRKTNMLKQEIWNLQQKNGDNLSPTWKIF